MSESFPEGAVTLSFDDGWRSVHENARPILERYGMKGTFYVVAAYLNDALFPQYMNAEEVREMERLGHEIGCHSAGHKHLPNETPSIIESEVSGSLKFLQDAGFTVDTFAYPYGEYNDAVLETVKRAGFKGARSIIEGFNTKDTDPFLLMCQAVKVDTPFATITAWIDAAKKSNTWLILMFHQVDHEGRAWSTTPEILADIVRYLQDERMNVITVREGLQLMKQ